MKPQNYFLGTVLMLIGIISIEACKKNDVDLVIQPVFSSDTTGDRVAANTIITYNIYQDRLYPYQNYQPAKSLEYRQTFWDAEKKNLSEHEKIFSLFTTIIPEEYRREITYFSIADPVIDDFFAAIGVQKNYSLERFNLAANPNLLVYTDSIPEFKAPKFSLNTLGYGIAIYAMIHEFGHYVTLNNKQTYLVYSPATNSYSSRPKPGSTIDSVNIITWIPNLKEEMLATCFEALGSFYSCFPAGEFVSAYAGKNINEDAAESFAHFVLLDKKPTPGTGANNKILLFYRDPQLVTLRQAIRDNLTKMGVVPKAPNTVNLRL